MITIIYPKNTFYQNLPSKSKNIIRKGIAYILKYTYHYYYSIVVNDTNKYKALSYHLFFNINKYYTPHLLNRS